MGFLTVYLTVYPTFDFVCAVILFNNLFVSFLLFMANDWSISKLSKWEFMKSASVCAILPLIGFQTCNVNQM